METMRIYDNGGKTLDRYTVLYMDDPQGDGSFGGRGMNSAPFHGIGYYITGTPGRHLGKRIKLEDLPEDCQKLIKQDMKEEK